MMGTRDILVEALSEAFATMAFLATGPVDDQMALPQQTVLAQMCFHGPKNGTLQILGSVELGSILAENIGCVSRPDGPAVQDAWKEICNVTCGLVIPRIAASAEQIYDVSVPSIQTGSQSPGWEPFISQAESHVVNVEGYATAVRLVVNQYS
jgi:hypothetical protein